MSVTEKQQTANWRDTYEPGWREREAALVSEALEKLGQAISAALDEAPAADVLSVLTGAFVSLTVELVRRQGHDVGKTITVDGGKQRDITIHAPKP